MKKLLVLISSIFVITALAIAQQDTAPVSQDRIVSTFEKANQWLGKNNLSITTSPEQAFLNDYIVVAAEGLPSPTAKTAAQKRLTAERAATTIAYRQLAELIDGVAVVGDTLVKDTELQYDIVRTAVAGFIKGAQVVYKEWDSQEEVALVIVKIGMSGPEGFGSLMYKKIIGDPKIKRNVVESHPELKVKPVKLEENYDGLIIDATSVNFRPALINRIFTSKGEAIYDPSKVSQKVLIEQGCGEYTNSIEKAKAALEKRGVTNPLVIKAAGIVTPSDVQVSDEDAIKIYSANQKTNFFAGAKVAFVLK
ncbi:hypothetical protein [Thermodesulfovibrio thiophilus]|uniref:hypothetical protein n=1 Tax=Thermodesulfovibrio thiophilus TaxID=340095 RepID=UPI0003FE058E|nr:hypothetical protein [Thermodesulfovibrio thiophilus]